MQMEATSYYFHSQQQSYHMVGLLCIWLVVLAGSATLWLWKTPSVRVLSVQSGSMQPLIHKGDAVIVIPVAHFTGSTRALAVGDIVSYHSLKDAQLVITHRIQFINQQNGLITTKGDNNLTVDWPITSEQIIGRMSERIVGLGYVIDTLHSLLGLILVIYLPALIAIILEVRRLTSYFKPTYVLRL